MTVVGCARGNLEYKYDIEKKGGLTVILVIKY